MKPASLCSQDVLMKRRPHACAFSRLLCGKRWEPGSAGTRPLAESVCKRGEPGTSEGRELARVFSGFISFMLLSPFVFQVAKPILAPRAARAASRRLRSTCLLREASGPLSHASRPASCPLLCNC